MMPALATLTLVWLGAQKPEGRAKAALDAWAQDRGARFEEPRTAAQDVDRSVGLSSQCEQALEQARDQLTSGDAEAARQTLRQLEQTLRDHPELIQAAWLMAERDRLEGQILAPQSPDDAATWDTRADALEGERATAFAARAHTTRAPTDNVTVTFAVHGARKFEVWWDGVNTMDRTATAAGEHHLAIRQGGRAAWSGWISVLASGTVSVWVPDAPPCSRDDMAGASFGEKGDPVVPGGVRCEAWAMAAPGPTPGTIQIALCNSDRCQPAGISAYDTFGISPAATDAQKKSTLPGWAVWTIAGAGVVAATTLVVWGSGAFDRAAAGQKVVWSP